MLESNASFWEGHFGDLGALNCCSGEIESQNFNVKLPRNEQEEGVPSLTKASTYYSDSIKK